MNHDEEWPVGWGWDKESSRRFVEDGAALMRANDCFAFMRAVPIFFELDDAALWDLAHFAEVVEFQPGERVVTQGDPLDSYFYVIRSGTAHVLRQEQGLSEKPVARLATGSYFGELGLLTYQARNASVVVGDDEPLVTYAFDAQTFHRRIAEHVLVFRVIQQQEQRAQSRTSQPLSGKLRLRDLEILQRLPPHELDYVLQNAEHSWHDDGLRIIEQGDEGDEFFIVLDGEVVVERDGQALATLSAGDFFGETALLLDRPRSAAVISRGRTLTWSIKRQAFQRLVGGYLLSHPRAQQTIMQRMKSITGQ